MWNIYRHFYFKCISFSLGAFLIALFCTSISFAASISVNVSKKQVNVSDTLTLTIVIRGVGIERISIPQPFPNSFSVVNKADRPSLSQDSFGKPITIRVIEYTLQATAGGRFRLGNISFSHNGESYQTSGQEIEVKGGQPPPEIKEKPVEPINPKIDPANVPLDVRLSAELSQTKAYVGETVNLSVRVTSTTAIDQIKVVDIPAFINFWNKELVLNKKSTEYKELLIKGLPYATQVIHRFTLSPTTSGKLSIPELTYSMVAGSDPRKSKALTLKTSPITLEALALPTKGKPAEFSGAVGKSKLNVRLKDSVTSVGVPTKLIIEVETTTNPEIILPPNNPEVGNGLKLYTPKAIKEEKTEEKNFVTSKAVWEAEVIASEAGKFTIPPFNFAYFDPESVKYKTIQSQALSLEVSAANIALTPNKPLTNPVTNFPSWITYLGMLVVLISGIAIGFKLKQMLPANNKPIPMTEPVALTTPVEIEPVSSPTIISDPTSFAPPSFSPTIPVITPSVPSVPSVPNIPNIPNILVEPTTPSPTSTFAPPITTNLEAINPTPTQPTAEPIQTPIKLPTEPLVQPFTLAPTQPTEPISKPVPLVTIPIPILSVTETILETPLPIVLPTQAVTPPINIDNSLTAPFALSKASKTNQKPSKTSKSKTSIPALTLTNTETDLINLTNTETKKDLVEPQTLEVTLPTTDTIIPTTTTTDTTPIEIPPINLPSLEETKPTLQNEAVGVSKPIIDVAQTLPLTSQNFPEPLQINETNSLTDVIESSTPVVDNATTVIAEPVLTVETVETIAKEIIEITNAIQNEPPNQVVLPTEIKEPAVVSSEPIINNEPIINEEVTAKTTSEDIVNEPIAVTPPVIIEPEPVANISPSLFLSKPKPILPTVSNESTVENQTAIATPVSFVTTPITLIKEVAPIKEVEETKTAVSETSLPTPITPIEEAKPIIANNLEPSSKSELLAQEQEIEKPVSTPVPTPAFAPAPIPVVEHQTPKPSLVAKSSVFVPSKTFKADALRLVNAAYGKLHRGDERAYHTELLKALTLVFENGFRIPASELTNEKMSQFLNSKGTDLNLRDSLIKLYQECEESAYSTTETKYVVNSEKDYLRFVKAKALVEKFLIIIS